MIQPRPPLRYEPTYLTRGPPALFSFRRARTEAWNVSFIISGQRLANRLSILCFEPDRVPELKSLVSNIFWRAEIDAWRCRAIREGYVPVSDIDLLPHPFLPLYEAAFANIYRPVLRRPIPPYSQTIDHYQISRHSKTSAEQNTFIRTVCFPFHHNTLLHTFSSHCIDLEAIIISFFINTHYSSLID